MVLVGARLDRPGAGLDRRQLDDATSTTWAIIGPIMAGLGVALVIVIVGRIRRGPDQQGPPGRYGQ